MELGETRCGQEDPLACPPQCWPRDPHGKEAGEVPSPASPSSKILVFLFALLGPGRNYKGDGVAVEGTCRDSVSCLGGALVRVRVTFEESSLQVGMHLQTEA